jgi:hypothetical protein
VTLSNTGNATLTITSITLGGSNAADFAQSGTCGASLTAGANCTISVTFKPAAAGARVASITISSNDPVNPTLTVALSGTGTAPVASVSPTSLGFGNQPINTSSTPQTVTLSNTGTATLSITGITLGGSNAADFAQSGTCGTSLTAGANCSLSVTFKPAAAGARAALITISTNDPVNPTLTVALSGTGTAAGSVTVSPSSVAFPGQLVNTVGGPINVTLTNNSSAVLKINSYSFSGPNASEFSQLNNCSGSKLAVGASCIIYVRFTPTATGTRTAVLSVSDSDPSSPQTVQLSGTGTAPGMSLSPTSLTFAAQTVNTTSNALTVTMTNPGTASLTISGYTFSGANPGDFTTGNNCTSKLAPGASCGVSVRFKPTAIGARSAALNISSSAGTQTVSLGGTGK